MKRIWGLTAVVIGIAGLSAFVAWRLRAPAPLVPNEGARGVGPTASPSASSAAPTASAAPRRAPPSRPDDELPATLSAQRERLYARMREELALSSEAMTAVRAVIDPSKIVGQGNPAITDHPMKRSTCFEVRERAGLHEPAVLDALAKSEARCGARYMVPASTKDDGPAVCIDQYEFPGIPCEYPLVYASAKQAAELCSAVGKRLCDAHEWEGACAGEIRPAELEYLWDRPRRIEMEFFKNQGRPKVWAYGTERDHGRCATRSRKSPKCAGGGWETCGSNTYPAGAFPECVSPFGVYDQHGNAAEHMNLPLKPSELSSRGGLGETEMKGSWFIFARESVHEDDCRWRAPAWHVTRVTDVLSHSNYHLGFRCCKSVP